MPIFFGAIGIVLIICAVNNTLANGQDGLVDLVKGDFTGQNSFLVWLIALLVAGAVGYIPKFKPVSYAFIMLIFVVIILSNQKSSGSGGVFANLFNAFLHPATGTPASVVNVNTASSSGSSGGGGGDWMSEAFSVGKEVLPALLG